MARKENILLCNHPLVAQIVRKHLAYKKITIKYHTEGRDLGVLLVGGAGRRTSIQHMRMRSAGERFSRVRWLSRICWKARNVGRGNPFAVALWGVEVLWGSTIHDEDFPCAGGGSDRHAPSTEVCNDSDTHWVWHGSHSGSDPEAIGIVRPIHAASCLGHSPAACQV